MVRMFLVENMLVILDQHAVNRWVIFSLKIWLKHKKRLNLCLLRCVLPNHGGEYNIIRLMYYGHMAKIFIFLHINAQYWSYNSRFVNNLRSTSVSIVRGLSLLSWFSNVEKTLLASGSILFVGVIGTPTNFSSSRSSSTGGPGVGSRGNRSGASLTFPGTCTVLKS